VRCWGMRVTAVVLAGVVAVGGSPAGAAAAGQTRCAGPVLTCVRSAEHTLTAVRDGLACDHRAPFASVYVHVQRQLARTLRAQPGYFSEPSWLAGDLNTGFVDAYLTALRLDRAGDRSVPAAWRIAFDAARGGGTNAGQDVLLGVNAHIQRDMPFVLEQLGLTRPDGRSRQTDFDRFQLVLDRAYIPAVEEVARSYDPVAGLADARWNPVAGITAHELLWIWRTRAWQNAQRLGAARSPAQHARVAESIEAEATRWAVLLASVRLPARNVVRDAWCARAHTGRQPATRIAGVSP
jgi:hypothetical protein